MKRHAGVRLKLALNSYSFNRPLMAHQMTLDDVIDYCAAQNIDGLDATGYYFPGYPKVPGDQVPLRPEEEGLPQRRHDQRNRRSQRLHAARFGRPQRTDRPRQRLDRRRREDGRVLHSRVLRSEDAGRTTPSTRFSSGWSRRSGMRRVRRPPRRDRRAAAPRRLPENGGPDDSGREGSQFRLVQHRVGCRQRAAGRSVRGDRKAGALRLHVADQGRSVRERQGHADRSGEDSRDYRKDRISAGSCRSKLSDRATRRS